jgi:hypothetical protein
MAPAVGNGSNADRMWLDEPSGSSGDEQRRGDGTEHHDRHRAQIRKADSDDQYAAGSGNDANQSNCARREDAGPDHDHSRQPPPEPEAQGSEEHQRC